MSNVTVNKVKQLAGGALYSSDSNHVVTTADQIYDEQRGCYVSEYDFSGNVKSVNNQLPDQNGNITLNDKIKTVNGFEPDRFGNIDATNSIFFSLNNNTIACLKNSQRLSTQSQLADLYNELTNIGLNVQAQKYSIVFDPCSEVLDTYLLGDVLIFLFQKFTDYTYQKEQYIQVKLTPAGVLSYEYITKNDVRSLSLSGNSLLVNTNTGQEEIPLPVIQSNWAQQDSNQPDFIQNKPLQYYIVLGENNTEWTVSTYPPVDNPFNRLINDLNRYQGYNNLNLNLQRINIGDGNGRMVHPITYDNNQSTHYFSFISGDTTFPSDNLYFTKIKCNNQGIFQYIENTRLDLKAGNNVEINNGNINVDLSSTEIKSNKVEAITEENKESTTKYPSIKALVDYVKDIKPQEVTLEAKNLSEFLAHARTISENTSSSNRYRLNIKGVIDFSAPESADKQATIKWKTNNNYSVYNDSEKTWNFEGIFMYTTIVGISANAALKTTYTTGNTAADTIDTVTLKLYTGNFENISIGGVAVSNNSNGHIHFWSRSLFLGTNNINYKFTNCSFPILGHESTNSSDNSKHCLLIKTEADSSSHEGTSDFQFNHTSLKFINCSWSPGRNKAGKAEGNLANAQIILDFSTNNSLAYTNANRTRNLIILANTKISKFDDTNADYTTDLPEIGIPQFYIKGYNRETWSVSSDAHALVKSDANASIRYFATIQVQDIFLKEAAYTKTNDASFNTNYQLVKYIQDLEDRIKTLETRLNTN